MFLAASARPSCAARCHGHDLRQREAGRHIGRDALGGQVAHDVHALLAGRHLDHHVLRKGMQLVRLRVHDFLFGEQARIKLARDPPVAAAGSLEQRKQLLRPALDDLLIGHPPQILELDPGVGLDRLVDPLFPRRRVGLDRRQRQRRVGRAAPEDALAHVVPGEQALELSLQFLLLPGRCGVDVLLHPAVEDQRGRVPPDLGIRIGSLQTFHHTLGHRLSSCGRC